LDDSTALFSEPLPPMINKNPKQRLRARFAQAMKLPACLAYGIIKNVSQTSLPEKMDLRL
jgi:hypothetical protein